MKKFYKSPKTVIVETEVENMICCSCIHNCIGTKCGCGCKGWTDDEIQIDDQIYNKEQACEEV